MECLSLLDMGVGGHGNVCKLYPIHFRSQKVFRVQPVIALHFMPSLKRIRFLAVQLEGDLLLSGMKVAI